MQAPNCLFGFTSELLALSLIVTAVMSVAFPAAALLPPTGPRHGKGKHTYNNRTLTFTDISGVDNNWLMSSWMLYRLQRTDCVRVHR
jgi:hypothetical protein